MKNIIFILLLSVTCYAQKNNVYLELTTQYILTTSGTINYERQLFSNTPIMIRAGFGYYASSGFGNTETYYTVPLTINYLIRLSDMNYIDFGIGPNLIGNVFDSTDAPKNILYLFKELYMGDTDSARYTLPILVLEYMTSAEKRMIFLLSGSIHASMVTPLIVSIFFLSSRIVYCQLVFLEPD